MPLDPSVVGFVRRVHPSNPDLLRAEPRPSELDQAIARARALLAEAQEHAENTRNHPRS